MSTTTRTPRGSYWPTALVQLARARTPSLYWPTVLLALAAMTPGLINVTALDLARPTIGDSLGVSADEASWATLLGSAALPLGFLVAANLFRYVPLRRIVLAALGISAAGALCSAVAANLPMLVLAHTVQGFACGLASSAVVLSLLVESTPNRLPVTITTLGIGLFGAATLGAPIGGIVEQTATWREFLVLQAIVALFALIPARAAVPNSIVRQDGHLSIPTLLLAATGLLLFFLGVGQLWWYHWTRYQVQVPLILGGVALVALIVGEWARGGPLARLSVAAVGKICAVAAFAFGGLLGLLLEFLQQVRGLGAQDAGMLLWPAPVTAFLALVWVGVVFSRPRWIVPLAGAGLLLLALAAWQLTTFTEYTGDAGVMQMAALLGLGAGISVAPAMLLGSVSGGKDLVGRALALMTFMPYVLLAASGPILVYISTVRQTVHYTNLQWEEGWKLAMSGTNSAGPTTEALLKRALMLGINDAALVVLLVTLMGLGVAAVLARRGRPTADLSR